ncbi:hypothetical protein [Mariniblastus fucicola]|nr:hypothetical protein [Mariniblastus fucicola]
MSVTDKLLAGMIDEEENDHPGTLKIDGISAEAEDGSSWHIRCHVCDSVLLVTDHQVGSKVKCNDCYSMLEVLPRKQLAKLDGETPDASGSPAEEPLSLPPVNATDSDDSDSASDSASASDSDFEELTLMPELELAPEIADAQKETFIEELVEDDDVPELTDEHLEDDVDDDEPIQLMDPIYVAPVSNPLVKDSTADFDDDDDDSDSDEMIEVLDVAPEELNCAPVSTPALPAAAVAEVKRDPKRLPRVPRKGSKKKQPNAIPVEDDEDIPVRVHAKRRRKRDEETPQYVAPKGFQFDQAQPGEILDKAVGLLKSGNIWIWSLVAIALMATGSSVWQWLRPDRLDVETTTLATRMMAYATGWIFGQAIFFIGYVVLLFVGGVVFREAAQGKSSVDSVSATDFADFTSTMLLFGFSMFVAALPCMFFGYMFVSLPIQFLLAGVFLFAAWKNQGAFSIVSGSIAESFSKQSASWKNWLIGAGIAAAGGIFGGLLMEVDIAFVSVFTSIVGAVIIAFATLLYAAITGWHCGHTVETLSQAKD